MGLFTEKIEDIKIEDIEGLFNSKEPESETLDYKSKFKNESGDISGRLENTIAAMANTEGGIIVVGIKTNDANIPEELVGIDLEGNFRDALENKLHSKVFPYPKFEISSPIPHRTDSEKCFLVVRVPKSNKTPHMISGENVIYVRRGSQCKQVDLGTLEKLFQKRQDVIKLAYDEDIGYVYTTLFPGQNPTIREMKIVPVFTRDMKIECNNDMIQFLISNRPSIMGAGEDYQIWPDGVELIQPTREREFFKFKDNGALFFRKMVKTLEGDVIVLIDDLKIINEILKYAQKIYEKIGYKDEVIFGYKIGNSKHKFLKFDYKSRDYGIRNYICKFQDVNFKTKKSFLELQNNKIEIIKDVFKFICRYFNCSPREEIINKIIASL